MNPMHRQRHSAQATTEYGIAIALIAVIAIAALASASVAVGGAFGFINQRVEAVIPTSGSGSTPTAFVTPAIQSVGQTVSVSGSGYTPDSSVTITLHSTPVVLGTTTADSAGNVGPVVETIPLGTDTTITHTITLSTATQTGISNDLTVTAPIYAVGLGVDGSTMPYVSADNGATWTVQPGMSDFIAGVAAADATHAFEVGFNSAHDGVIDATSNGGTTWTQQLLQATPFPVAFTGVAASDASHAYAVGLSGTGGIIYATSNGGTTWTQQLTTPGQFDGVAVAGTDDAYAVGLDSSGNAVIYATSNGGTTWNEQFQITGAIGDAAHFAAVTAAGTSAAYAVGSDGSGNAVIYATSNGGASWTQQFATPGRSFYGVAVAP